MCIGNHAVGGSSQGYQEEKMKETEIDKLKFKAKY